MDERGIGNGWLLPAGPLREPWPRRTTMLLQITASPQAMSEHNAPLIPPGQATFQAQRTLADTALRADGQQHALTDWIGSGQAVTALAGIAQPAALHGKRCRQALAAAAACLGCAFGSATRARLFRRIERLVAAAAHAAQSASPRRMNAIACAWPSCLPCGRID
jgi:hypothetical protein